MTVLADANVLIALTVVDHEHHQSALDWFDSLDEPLATCPITQGSLVRFLIREGVACATAAEVIEQLTSQSWHHFVPDDIPYRSTLLSMVVGHRQVTDAYLASLAQRHEATVATFDKGMASIYPNNVTLVRGT